MLRGFALKHLARRCHALDAEITNLDAQLAQLTATASPRLIKAFGVGADTAGALLVAAGDNPDRLRSEAAFSMLCGSSPIKASSGKTSRHRLNRGGNRQANAALYRIVLVRMRYHQPTKHYVERRTSEGKANARSSAASNVTSPARSTQPSHKPANRNSPEPLDIIGASPPRVSGGRG